MQRKNIIYILCPGHSGSTLLEYYFSTYPGKIGIGEVYKAVRSFRDNGTNSFSDYDRDTIKSTSFWRNIISTTNQYDSSESQYKGLYKYLNESENLSQYDTIIDSSKSLHAFRILHKEYGDNIKVAVVMKDVRSWIVSQFDNNHRKNRKIPFFYNFRLLIDWYKKYFNIMKNLDAMNVNYTIVPYDLFCLNGESVQSYLKDQFSLNGEADFSNTNSINILGNRMKKEANLALEIKYDYRWVHRSEWNLPWFILPTKFKKYNYDHVWKIDSEK